MNKGKTFGWIAIFLAIAALVLAGGFMASGLASHKLSIGGAVLGFILFGALPALALGAFGIFMLVKGKAEAKEMAQAEQMQKLLGMIQSHGQVSLSQVMIEMKLTRQQITDLIYQMVSLGLFTGYIDWDSMTFYAAEASKVVSTVCPNCGGIREFVGKGIVKCPYCGATIFIPPDAEVVQNAGKGPQKAAEASPKSQP